MARGKPRQARRTFVSAADDWSRRVFTETTQRRRHGCKRRHPQVVFVERITWRHSSSSSSSCSTGTNLLSNTGTKDRSQDHNSQPNIYFGEGVFSRVSAVPFISFISFLFLPVVGKHFATPLQPLSFRFSEWPLDLGKSCNLPHAGDNVSGGYKGRSISVKRSLKIETNVIVCECTLSYHVVAY